jgi:beta-N-acetylhexosaminidase
LPDESPRAVVLGCSGESLSAFERSFLRAADPLGFILFRRNCTSPDQVRDLVRALRECVGRDDAPVLIDQEGGRVARLKPPHWRTYPSAARVASLPDPQAEHAARLAARLIADDLSRLEITVDCLPVLDLPVSGADPVIGDRAYGSDPGRVARLARAVCEGLLEGGVLPVLKHIPGHGRAGVDSHYACPVVEAARDELACTDLAPFRALADMPWAMTAHIVYTKIDAAAPATLSPRVVREIIRGEIGFDGVLVSDDLSMRALGGALGERTQRALAAGCDLALHCNGVAGEMEEVVAAAEPIGPRTAERLARAEAMRRRSVAGAFERGDAEAQLDALLMGARIPEFAER